MPKSITRQIQDLQSQNCPVYHVDVCNTDLCAVSKEVVCLRAEREA